MNPLDIDIQKNELRRQYIQQQKALPPVLRQSTDNAICQNVLVLSEYKAAKTVFVYVGIDWEIDTRPILADALSRGKILCVPCCLDDGVMTAKQLASLDALHPGRFGIPEATDGPEIASKSIDLALIPCVSCTRGGKRLGRGGGYYDRFLRDFPGCSAILCRESAISAQIPTEVHDIPVPLLVSDSGVYRN